MGRYELGQFTGSRNRYTTAGKLNILAVYNKLRSEGNLSLTHAVTDEVVRNAWRKTGVCISQIINVIKYYLLKSEDKVLK